MAFKPKTEICCLKCYDVVYSSHEGEMTWCSCFSCAIDETEHYLRVMGDDEWMIVREYRGTGQDSETSD